MPLPFELRAVEMALKDSKGRNIAEKIDELDSKPAGTKLYLHRISFSDYFYKYNVSIGETGADGTPFIFSNETKGSYAAKNIVCISPRSEPFTSTSQIASSDAHTSSFNTILEHETSGYKIISRVAGNLNEYMLAVQTGYMTSSSFNLYGFKYSTSNFTDTVFEL